MTWRSVAQKTKKYFQGKVSTTETAYQEHSNELKEIIQHAIKFGTGK